MRWIDKSDQLSTLNCPLDIGNSAFFFLTPTPTPTPTLTRTRTLILILAHAHETQITITKLQGATSYIANVWKKKRNRKK